MKTVLGSAVTYVALHFMNTENKNLTPKPKSDSQPAETALKWKSCAEWPKGTFDSQNNYTEDTHDSLESAKAVCRGLENRGAGGDGKAFPIRTWTETILSTPPSVAEEAKPVIFPILPADLEPPADPSAPLPIKVEVSNPERELQANRDEYYRKKVVVQISEAFKDGNVRLAVAYLERFGRLMVDYAIEEDRNRRAGIQASGEALNIDWQSIIEPALKPLKDALMQAGLRIVELTCERDATRTALAEAQAQNKALREALTIGASWMKHVIEDTEWTDPDCEEHTSAKKELAAVRAAISTSEKGAS